MEALQQEYDLTTLRVGLEYGSADGVVRCTLSSGENTITEVTCSPAELGLPAELSDLRRGYSEPSYRLPERLASELRNTLSSRLDADMPLWLQFAPACGDLSVIPWERLLHQAVPYTVLRVPYFSLSPFSSTATALDIVLCVSAPRAKGMFDPAQTAARLARHFLALVERERVVVHIFADADLYGTLRAQLDGVLGVDQLHHIALYDPEAARRYSPQEAGTEIRESQGSLSSPWLRWMVDSLGTRSADLIHFICHGYHSTSQGALALAESPVINNDETIARFIGARQLATFVKSIGAWSFGLSLPEPNYSNPGSRRFVETIAQLRPGPVLCHDLKYDHDLSQIDAAYRFLCNETGILPELQGAVSLACHPSRLTTRHVLLGGSGPTSDALSEYTLASGESQELLSSPENVPVWVASTQRYLEQAAAQIVSQEPVTESQQAQKSGQEEALREIAAILRRHTVTGASEGQSSV